MKERMGRLRGTVTVLFLKHWDFSVYSTYDSYIHTYIID